MGFKSAVSGVGKWLWSFVKKTAKVSQEAILEDIKQMAYVVVEDVGNLDLNGDGKVSAAMEVLDLAKASGQKWGRKLLEDGQTEAYNYLQVLKDGDFKRYLALGRISVQVAKKFGLDKTPTTHVILGIIQAVLGDEDQ
jgi:hypothetical protein